MNQLTLNVPDISCGHCKAAIEGALVLLDGIGKAEVHVDERTVEVSFDETKLDRNTIVAAIEAQGYEVEAG